MPPKICGKCSKTVYPTEELKCLDKVWHKGCFKCQECNMTLNMKNYRGYNKLPYCNAHYPTTKHTVVADTPENRRITKNTQIQSNVKYHEDFEKAKGSKISVAADPETERIKKTMQTISNVSYHGELEKKMEQESHRPSHAVEVAGEPSVNDVPPSAEQQQHGAVTMNQPHRHQPGSISNYDPMAKEPVFAASPYSNQRVGTRVYSSSQAQQSYGGNRSRPGLVCCAIYDYTAADDDEVSFRDGDRIVNCMVIDEGWMTGTVERSGQHGMLPANYVEPIKQ